MTGSIKNNLFRPDNPICLLNWDRIQSACVSVPMPLPYIYSSQGKHPNPPESFRRLKNSNNLKQPRTARSDPEQEIHGEHLGTLSV